MSGHVCRFAVDGQMVGSPSPQLGGGLSRILPLPDGRCVAIHNGKDGVIVLSADLQQATRLTEAPSAYGGSVTPDGRRLAIAGMSDQRVQVWDLTAEPAKLHWQLPIRSSFYARGIAISADGNTVVVGDGDGQVSVFDVPRGVLVRKWQAHDGVINDLDLAADGRIATAGLDRTAAVWSAAGKRLAHLRGHTMCVWSARFTASGRHLVTASDDGAAFVWPLDAADVLAMARRDLRPEARQEELASRRALVGDLLDRR